MLSKEVSSSFQLVVEAHQELLIPGLNSMRCPAFVPGFVYPLTAPPFLLIPELELHLLAPARWLGARMKIAAPVKGQRTIVGFMVAKRVEDRRET